MSGQQSRSRRPPPPNRKAASYFDRRRNKHDTPHALDNVLVILGDPVDTQHAKVAPDCVLSLFRRILVSKLSRLKLVHPNDISSAYNSLVTIYYNDDRDTPEGVFVNIRAENVHVYAEHSRILLVIDQERGWGMNLLWVSPETAQRICSQQYWLVFQRVINDTIFDLKKQIYQVEGIYYAPIYYDQPPPPRPKVASTIETPSPLPPPEEQEEEEEEGACLSPISSNDGYSITETYDEAVHGCIMITALADEVQMEDVEPISLRFAY